MVKNLDVKMDIKEQCLSCYYYDKEDDVCWSDASLLEPMTGINCKYFKNKNKDVL